MNCCNCNLLFHDLVPTYNMLLQSVNPDVGDIYIKDQLLPSSLSLYDLIGDGSTNFRLSIPMMSDRGTKLRRIALIRMGSVRP